MLYVFTNRLSSQYPCWIHVRLKCELPARVYLLAYASIVDLLNAAHGFRAEWWKL